MGWPQLSGFGSWFKALPCPYRHGGRPWPRPTSLMVLLAPALALGPIPVAEAIASCLGSLPIPALARRAGSLLEAAVGWTHPIGNTTWAFYSTLPAPAPAPGSALRHLPFNPQTFSLPLQARAGLVLGHSAWAHMHQLQQELRRAERAVPAPLPFILPASCSQPQRLDVSAEPGHGACSPWLGPHPQVPAVRDPKTILW